MREGGQSNLDRVMAPSLRNEWAWHGADNEGNVGCSRRPALAPPESISEPNRGAIVVSCRFPRILGQPDSLDFQLLQGRTDNTAFRSRGHEHSTPAEIDRLQKAGLSPYFFDSQRQQPPPRMSPFLCRLIANILKSNSALSNVSNRGEENARCWGGRHPPCDKQPSCTQ